MNISVLKVREKLADGKGVAARVSMDDLALLEKLEDESDARAVRNALAAIKSGKRKSIDWAEAKVELRAVGTKR